jgi:hypothetical protein
MIEWDQKTIKQLREGDTKNRLVKDKFVSNLRGGSLYEWHGTFRRSSPKDVHAWRSVELRTMVNGTNVLIVLKGGEMPRFSMNAKLHADPSYFRDIAEVIEEGNIIAAELRVK